MKFIVTLSKPITSAVSINYRTKDNSASAADEYTARQGTLNFPAGSTYDTIYVPIYDDFLAELDKEFFVELSNPFNAIIADSQAVGFILDNDAEAAAFAQSSIPLDYSLSQNYPNPFNLETTIEYGLPGPDFVVITIFDIKGCLVRNLISEQQSAGNHSVIWDARDNYGTKVTSGVSFYLMKVEDSAEGGADVFSRTNKMILMK